MQTIVGLYPEAPQHIGISTDDFDTLLFAEATTLDSIEDMCYTNIRDNISLGNPNTADTEAIFDHIEGAFTQLRAFRKKLLERANTDPEQPQVRKPWRRDPYMSRLEGEARDAARLQARRER